MLDPAALRAFALRPRDEVADLKVGWWADRHRETGGAANVSCARALYAHARAVRPDWPTAEDRAVDLAHHVALKAKIDRASRALAGR